MSNFYEKKQAEIQEEVSFLIEEKRHMRRKSNSIYEKILELESELRHLVEQENAIIDRLNSIRNSGAKFYGIDLEASYNALYGPYTINNALRNVESLANRFSGHVAEIEFNNIKGDVVDE